MSTYLKFYSLEHSPFEDEAQSKVVLGTKALRDALSAIQNGIAESASRICVNGGAGMGKTSLAIALPQLLGDGARVAVIRHPGSDWEAHRGSIARQWRLGEGGLARATLLEAARTAPLVLVIDEAESADAEFLDHLDVLLSYRSEADQPIVQSVLLADLSLARQSGGSQKAEPPALLWWLDRIQTLELEFAPLPREGVDAYLQKHLKRAGWRGERLFSRDACYALHDYSGGIPRELGRLAEALMAEAAERDLQSIDTDFVHERLNQSATGKADGDDDEFEALVSEEEFVGADQAPEQNPSNNPAATFCESLQGQDSESASDEARDAIADPDAVDGPDGGALADFHAYLSAPPTEAELRELSGSRFGPIVRMAAAIAVAIGIGALAIAWLRPNAEPLPSFGLVPKAVVDEVAAARPEVRPAPVLAKPKGPVPNAQAEVSKSSFSAAPDPVRTDQDPAAPAAADPASPPAAPSDSMSGSTGPPATDSWSTNLP